MSSDQGPSFDRLAHETSEAVDRRDTFDQAVTGPIQDAQQVGPGHRQNFAKAKRQIYFGTIVLSLPHVDWYVVNLDGLNSSMPCCRGQNGSVGPLGMHDVGTYQPNTPVIVAVPPNGISGVILCSMPLRLTDASLQRSDWITQGSGYGYRKEKYYGELPSKLGKVGGGINNHSYGQPMDASAIGEWGQLAETGVGFFADPWMAFMRVNEMCGFWAFYWDDLARIAGRNLDIRTAGHEIIARDDEGEFQYFHGDTGYPWEALGSFAAEGEVHTETGDREVTYDCTKAKYEPKEQDQQSFYRYQEWGGYLGQGRHRMVSPPPRQEGLWRYQDEDPLQGLFSEHIGYNGYLGVQTAKGFSFIKRAAIANPKQIRLPEDARDDSDNKDNYKAAGEKGSGPEHKIGDLKNEEDYPQIKSVAAILEQHAHVFNWQRLHPYHYHEKDYHTPQETELPKLTKVQVEVPFDDLKDKMWLDRPEPKPVWIDSRYGEVDYFENTSGISFTDDGGFIIFDGWGTSIRATGGNLQLSPAGNLLLQPGKSLIGLAGDDVCVRARQSVDISAALKDVRIKAERNLHCLAGNDESGEGGVMVECRSQGREQNYQDPGEDVVSRGIVFKSNHSPVALYGAGVYVRTGSEDGHVDAGEIVLDANKGQSDVVVMANSQRTYAENSVEQYFGADNVRATNQFSHNENRLGSDTAITGGLRTTGGGLFGEDINVANGHINTTAAAQGSTDVGPIERRVAQTLRDNLADLNKQSQDAVEDAQDNRQGHIEDDYYATNQLGNEELLRQLEFSFRNEEQYGTEDFMLPATYWQQMAADQGQGIPWEEPAVKHQEDTDLLPWPGQKNWDEQETYHQVKLELFTDGADAERGEKYEDASFGEWEKKIPKEAYLVIDVQ